MRFQRYLDQVRDWPPSGRHIMAHYDADSIYVYQAYRPSIARFAVAHQQFGGDFSFRRMGWIKPSFLWMMYRAGWARKKCIAKALHAQLALENPAKRGARIGEASQMALGDSRLPYLGLLEGDPGRAAATAQPQRPDA